MNKYIVRPDVFRESIVKSISHITNKSGDVYEFGVHGGNTIHNIFMLLKKNNIEYNNLYGFDSFCGFPNFKDELKKDPNTYTPWETMDFNFTEDQSLEEALNGILKRFDGKKPILIPGFYDDVLTDDLVEKYNMKPALFVHMDSDLYTSTYTVLDFMFRNNLIIKNTIVTYDEWSSFFKSGDFGEERAHNEITEKYNLKWEFLERSEVDKAIFRLI